ncbi:Autophagy-Related Protein 2-like B [Manis pentadactyla]|nr:Autophagy-Related Protein 2-like B [Manis pentadactyla]
METGISVSTNAQGDSQKHALMPMTKKEKLPNGIHTSQGWRTGLLPPTHPASRGAWPVADLEARSRTSPGVEQQLLRLLPGRLRPREFSAAQAVDPVVGSRCKSLWG